MNQGLGRWMDVNAGKGFVPGTKMRGYPSRNTSVNPTRYSFLCVQAGIFLYHCTSTVLSIEYSMYSVQSSTMPVNKKAIQTQDQLT